MKLDRPMLRAILAVGGLLTTGAGLAADDFEDVGIVRISDQPPGAPCGSGHCQPGPNGAPCGNGGAYCGNGYGHCGHGYGQCGHGYGHCGHGCGGCFHQCHCTGHVHRFLSWLDPLGGCTLPPDAGWSPPGKVAMWRRGVAYTKFFPDAWTGAPAMPAVAGLPRAPWVYMPTDTTQLGFYYQQVPMWVPAPGMIPGPPNPTEWHQPLFGAEGAMVVGASGETVNCPAAAPAAAPAEAPAAVPAETPAEGPAAPVPPGPMADLSATGEVPALQPIPR
jgi:hypothetical protein